MWALTVYFGGTSTVLTYKTEMSARKWAGEVSNGLGYKEISDDFGGELMFSANADTAFKLENIIQTLELSGEMQMLQMRQQIKTNQKAQNDPAIRLAMQGGIGGGPMVRA